MARIDQAQVNVLHNLLTQHREASDYFQSKSAGAHAKGVTVELERQARTEVASVLASSQLGTVKASVAALTGLMPRCVGRGENNYTGDNRTMLRAGLADRYPAMGDTQAAKFINEVIDVRRQRPPAAPRSAPAGQDGATL